jgi:hypothetical protein
MTDTHTFDATVRINLPLKLHSTLNFPRLRRSKNSGSSIFACRSRYHCFLSVFRRNVVSHAALNWQIKLCYLTFILQKIVVRSHPPQRVK